MQRRDLIAHVQQETGMSKKDATAAVSAVIGGITNALTEGDMVVLMGFCTLVVRDRAAYTGRHPKTGEPVQVPARKQVVFKASKALSQAVNS